LDNANVSVPISQYSSAGSGPVRAPFHLQIGKKLIGIAEVMASFQHVDEAKKVLDCGRLLSVNADTWFGDRAQAQHQANQVQGLLDNSASGRSPNLTSYANPDTTNSLASYRFGYVALACRVGSKQRRVQRRNRCPGYHRGRQCVTGLG
jgi:hypothetical protein